MNKPAKIIGTIAGITLIFGAAALALQEKNQEIALIEKAIPACDEVVDIKRGSYRDEPMDVLLCKNGTAQMAFEYKKGYLSEKLAIHAKKGLFKKRSSINGARYSDDRLEQGSIQNSPQAQQILDIVNNGTSIPLGKALVQGF